MTLYYKNILDITTHKGANSYTYQSSLNTELCVKCKTIHRYLTFTYDNLHTKMSCV